MGSGLDIGQIYGKKKIKYVFLLGRPGCGKSIVFRKFLKNFEERGYHSFKKFDDFPILKSLRDSEIKSGVEKRFRSTPDGGFKVVDDSVWSELLVKLNERILRQEENGIVAIEFSRPNYVESLKLFSDKILENAIALYIDASFECCVARNEERTRRAAEEGLDAHFVSRKEMEETYLKDDKDELLKNSPIPVFLVKNDFNTSEEEIEKQVTEIIKKKLKNDC